ncbi:MAG TPA: hypothetical protein V6D11_07770 [Waterburya sp.]
MSEVQRYPTSPRSRVSSLDMLYFINLKYAVLAAIATFGTEISPSS